MTLYFFLTCFLFIPESSYFCKEFLVYLVAYVQCQRCVGKRGTSLNSFFVPMDVQIVDICHADICYFVLLQIKRECLCVTNTFFDNDYFKTYTLPLLNSLFSASVIRTITPPICLYNATC